MSDKAERPDRKSPVRRNRWQRRRNPMRPRAHAAHELFVATLVLVAVGMPVLGVFAGHVQYDMSDARSRRLAAQNRPVAAVLEQNVYSSSPAPRGGNMTAKVSWTVPDGSTRTSYAAVQSSGGKGNRTTIWLDPEGNPAEAPASRERVALNAIGAGVVAVLGGLGVLLVVYAAGHTAYKRSRMGAWARDWEAVAPTWTKTS